MNPIRGDWPTSNFSGNSGPYSFPRWAPAQASQFWPGQLPPRFPPSQLKRQFKGCFTVNSSTRFQEVSDGLSTTILAGERGAASGAGIWPGVTRNSHETDLLTDGSHPSRLNHGLGYSSSHIAINVLLCDGSARSLSPSLESLPSHQGLGLLQRLTGINDGAIVTEF
jgi:hypothetical protein